MDAAIDHDRLAARHAARGHRRRGRARVGDVGRRRARDVDGELRVLGGGGGWRSNLCSSILFHPLSSMFEESLIESGLQSPAVVSCRSKI